MWSTRQHLYRMFFFVALTLLVSGCAGIRQMTAGRTGNDAGGVAVFGDVLEGSYRAADILAAQLRARGEKADATLLTASFVDVNRLEESSPLGRLIAEQISSRMAQNGFQVLEMKLRQHSIYIKAGEGEFLLSRQIQEISASQNGDLLIVGTYAVAEKSIYISARIVNAESSNIVTGYDYQLERNFQMDSLL